MTHHTEAERALSSLRHLYQQMAGGAVKDSTQAKRIAEGLLSPAIEKLEQAARRAPAAPVPQGWKLVPSESTEEMARAFRADDAPHYFVMTTMRCNDFAERYRAAISAAPQPPEAAPVELPEPVYTMRVRGRMHDYTPTLSAFDLADGEHELYTEQQVRQLLADNSIGKAKQG